MAGNDMIGRTESMSKRFGDEEVRRFAQLSLDVNPIHLDEQYAKQSIFGKRIVHGFLVGSLISAVIGNRLPGFGSIYLQQEMNFRKPVFIDDEVTAVVEIVEQVKPHIYKALTRCLNQNGDVVIDGFAIIKFG